VTGTALDAPSPPPSRPEIVPRCSRGRRVLRSLLVLILLLGAAGVLLWNSPYTFMGLARGAARWRFGAEQRSIEIGGHRWPYLESGPRDAPPIVLLHGYGTSKDAMLTIMAWLSPEHRVLAPDLPGFGEHDEHEGERHDAAFYAREVVRFMDALGIERASVIGTSMGGAVAAEIAISDPERVDRLVLLAPAGLVPPIKNDFMLQADRGLNPLRLENEDDFDRVVQLVFLHPPPTPGPVRRYFALEAQRRLPGTNRIIEAMRGDLFDGLEGRLGAVKSPTLILWGVSDAVLDPSLLPRFDEEIADSRAALVPDAGHVLFHDAPDAVRAEVVPFLSRRANSAESRE